MELDGDGTAVMSPPAVPAAPTMRKRQFTAQTPRRRQPSAAMLLADSDDEDSAPRFPDMKARIASLGSPLGSSVRTIGIGTAATGKEAWRGHVRKTSRTSSAPAASVGGAAPSFSEIMARLELSEGPEPELPALAVLESSATSMLSNHSDLTRISTNATAVTREAEGIKRMSAGQQRASWHKRMSMMSTTSNEAVPTRAGMTGYMTPVMLSPSANQSRTSLLPDLMSESLDEAGLAALKLLRKRHAIVREIVLTEMSFADDMQLVVDQYATPATDRIGTVDQRDIFGSVPPVADFSNELAAELNATAQSVLYASADTLEQAQRDDHDVRIGAVFNAHMPRLRRVYASYCTGHDRATTSLQRLQVRSPDIAAWLAERHTQVGDRTGAWDLASLLIKPVQRVLKYPLLLATLLECTHRDHPDHAALTAAHDDMILTAENINAVKRRRDFVADLAKSGKKRSGIDASMITKQLGRRAIKLKEKVGLDHMSDMDDPVYDGLQKRLKLQHEILQNLQAEVTDWLQSMREALRFHAAYGAAFLDLAESPLLVDQATYVANRWSEYTSATASLQQVGLVQLAHDLERDVFLPLSKIQRSYDGPLGVVAQREKRVDDFVRFTTLAEKGPVQDKPLIASAEQFGHLHATLLLELPTFFRVTARAMEVIVSNLASIQAAWSMQWHEVLTGVVLPDPIASRVMVQRALGPDGTQSPHDGAAHTAVCDAPEEIREAFRERETFVQEHLKQLVLVNGALKGAFDFDHVLAAPHAARVAKHHSRHGSETSSIAHGVDHNAKGGSWHSATSDEHPRGISPAPMMTRTLSGASNKTRSVAPQQAGSVASSAVSAPTQGGGSGFLASNLLRPRAKSRAAALQLAERSSPSQPSPMPRTDRSPQQAPRPRSQHGQLPSNAAGR